MERRNHEKIIDIKVKINRRRFEDLLIKIMLFAMALISVVAFVLVVGCSVAMVEAWAINKTSLIALIISLVWLGFIARLGYELYIK